MAEYNIYKLRPSVKDKMIKVLSDDHGYVHCKTFVSKSYSVSSYFCDTQSTDIWWLSQYGNIFDGYTEKKNIMYSGVLVATHTNGVSYAIPLGKAHFYIQVYAEYNFGLLLAQKIVDLKLGKMKSLKKAGGKTSKSLTSYSSATDLEFLGGEFAEYVKLKPVDTSKWGDFYIHFGPSVKFENSSIDPPDIGQMLENIDAALDGPDIAPLPLMKEVHDKADLAKLNHGLINQLLSTEAGEISLLDYEVYGVDFLFQHQTRATLKYNTAHTAQLDSLTIDHIVSFIRDNHIPPNEALTKVKIKFSNDSGIDYTATILECIEYSTTEKYLYRGKWYSFNDNFIETLHTSINKIPVTKFDMDFSEADFLTWQAAQATKVKYRERFVLDIISTTKGFLNLDRELDTKKMEGRTPYKLEICDLYDAGANTFYVVKIGEPSDFSYAFDQAITTLSFINNNVYKSEKHGDKECNNMKLLLMFRGEKTLTQASDTKSIMFEIKLAQLRAIAKDKDVALSIEYSNIL